MSARRVVRTSDMKEMTSTMYALIIRVTSHAADEHTGSVLPHRLIRPRGRPQEARGTGEGARETSRRATGGGGIAGPIPPPGPVAVARSPAALRAVRTPRRTLYIDTYIQHGKGVNPSSYALLAGTRTACVRASVGVCRSDA